MRGGAAAVLLVAMVGFGPPAAADGHCGSVRTVEGTLLPAQTDTHNFVLESQPNAKQRVTIELVEDLPPELAQRVRLHILGPPAHEGWAVGTGTVTYTVEQAAPGGWQIEVSGAHLEPDTGVTGLALAPYTITISATTVCV